MVILLVALGVVCAADQAVMGAVMQVRSRVRGNEVTGSKRILLFYEDCACLVPCAGGAP